MIEIKIVHMISLSNSQQKKTVGRLEHKDNNKIEFKVVKSLQRAYYRKFNEQEKKKLLNVKSMKSRHNTDKLSIVPIRIVKIRLIASQVPLKKPKFKNDICQIRVCLPH